MVCVGFPVRLGLKATKKPIKLQNRHYLFIFLILFFFTDLKPCRNTVLHNKLQISWNAAVFNKLHPIKPLLGATKLYNRP